MDPKQSLPGPEPVLLADAMLRPTEALEGGITAPDQASEATSAAEERLAIHIGSLNLLFPPETGREVLLPPPVTRLSHTAEWLLGVANVRGALVPVVDLAMAFGLEHADDWRTYLLISGAGESAIGLLVDGLPVLQRIDAKRLKSIPPHPEILRGHVIAAVDHGGAIWLDVALEGVFKTLGERIASVA
jgi:purine-binding chemotaxis protein CheW